MSLERKYDAICFQFVCFFMTKEKKALNQMPLCERTENDEAVIKVAALVNRYSERAN